MKIIIFLDITKLCDCAVCKHCKTIAFRDSACPFACEHYPIYINDTNIAHCSVKKVVNVNSVYYLDTSSSVISFGMPTTNSHIASDEFAFCVSVV